MTLFDWLMTDQGRTFLIAVVGLLNAGTYYLWYLSHRDRAKIKHMLNGHLEQHVIEHEDRHSLS